MSPMTPGTTSSLLNWIGRGGRRCTARLLLHPWASKASEVDDSENVIPTAIPISRSRVNRVGSRRRFQTFEKMSVQAIVWLLLFHPSEGVINAEISCASRFQQSSLLLPGTDQIKVKYLNRVDPLVCPYTYLCTID
jgi:hypothetical protein